MKLGLWIKNHCHKRMCPVDTVEDINRQNLIREMKRAKDDLVAAESAWAWAEPAYVDAAMSLVDTTRARYQSLVREYKSTYGNIV